MTETVPEDEVQQARTHSLKIIESHMPKEKEEDAVKIAMSAMDSNKQLMDIANHIKTQYDSKYPGSGKATEGVYHAICGHHFATCLSHETHEYCHMKVDQLHIIIWKSKDNPFKPELAPKE
eukprot:jgi/Ulvmu1/202/UM001_0206.1